MKISQVLRLDQYSALAIVGAGGKSSALFQLAEQSQVPVWLTTSTHLAAAQTKLATRHIVLEEVGQIPDSLENGSTLFTGPIGEDARSLGLDEVLLEHLHEKAKEIGIPLLIEADGSRQRPLKAPAEHEPAIPQFAEAVVVVAGMQGVGQLLGEEHVHRPELFANLANIELGGEISAEDVVNVLLHPAGGLKNIPEHADRYVLLNQVDSPSLAGMVRKMSKDLLREYRAVITANLMQEEVIAVHQNIAGIVLAAGGSQRFGQTKQLLTWRGEPFVRAAAQTALLAGLSPVIVVTGADHDQVSAALEDLNVMIVHNAEWQDGQSTSVKAGLHAVPKNIGAAFFLLSDQPQIPVSLLETIKAKYTETISPITAPMIDGRRGNPVLFDRRTFEDFEIITGDMGGRQIFSKYRVEWVPWVDASVGLDVDTPEDYSRLLKYED